MKTFNTREIAAIKRQYKTSLPILKKVQSINKKIEQLDKEKEDLMKTLDLMESGIKAMTGGHTSVELIHCEYKQEYNEDGSMKMSKDGKYPIKTQILTFIEPTQEEQECSTCNIESKEQINQFN